MHFRDEAETRTIQLWQLSNLKLLKTIILPDGAHKSQMQPGEPHLIADGKTVLVHTFSCGLYEVSGLEKSEPSVREVTTFEGEFCGVPVRLGHYWIQTLSTAHALAAYDISDLNRIREVSRVTFDEKQEPHWIAADPSGRRIVLNSGEYADHRLYIVNFDPQTGALALDSHFRDPGSDKPGVSLDGKTWPHGFKGDAYPHGTVFSRTSPASRKPPAVETTKNGE
jgi:hypothetical protein